MRRMKIDTLNDKKKLKLAKDIFKAFYDATWESGGGMYPDTSHLKSRELHQLGIDLGYAIGSYKGSQDQLLTKIMEIIKGYLGKSSSYLDNVKKVIQEVLSKKKNPPVPVTT